MRMNWSICTSALHRLVRESSDLTKPLTSHPIFASNHFLSRRSHGCPSTADLNLWPLWWTNAEMADWWKLTMLYSSWRGRFEWTLLTLPPCFAQLLGLGQRWSITPSPLTWSSGWVRKERLPTVLLATFWWIASANWKDPILGPQFCVKWSNLDLNPQLRAFNTLINGLVGEGRIAKAMSLADEILARQSRYI